MLPSASTRRHNLAILIPLRAFHDEYFFLLQRWQIDNNTRLTIFLHANCNAINNVSQSVKKCKSTYCAVYLFLRYKKIL